MSAIRTLLVEDDDVDAQLLLDTLDRLEGDEVLEIERVDRLSAAIERLTTLDVDVVLLDLGLPDSRGLTTFLKFHDFAPHLPVVVLTGTENDLVALAAIEAGAQDYLAKQDLLGLPIPRILRYAMERHRLQTTLHRNMEMVEGQRTKLRALFDKALDAHLLLDTEGRILDANPAAEQLAGSGSGDLVGTSLEHIALSSDDRPLTLDEIRKDGGDSVFATLASRGTRREVEARVTLDVMPGEHLLALRDVTDQNASRRALQASEARFRELVESAHDAMYRLSLEPEVRTDYLSPAIEELTGFTPDDFRTRTSLWQERIHPDDLAAFRDRTVLASGESERIAYRWHHPDGSWRWIEDLRTPIITDGVLTGLSGVARDVSAQRRMDEALHTALDQERQATDRLREVDALKTTFLQAVSHELRTPLTVIRGFSLTLQKHADQLTAGRRADLVDRLVGASCRLERLLIDLLDVDRLNRGLMSVERRPTDVRALIDGVLAEIDRHDHPLTVEAPPDLVAALDAPKVERIIENLVRNAVKYTPVGTPITVNVAGGDQGIVLTVADAGPGIPQELAATIFEPFVQGGHAAQDASPGTGIGLSLVARFATLHGGTARVEPATGGGARFVVELPSRFPDREDEPAPLSASPDPHDATVSCRRGASMSGPRGRRTRR